MRFLIIFIILVSLNLSMFGQKITVSKIEVPGVNTSAFFPQFSPDGNKLYFTSGNYRGIWEFDFNNNQSLQLNDYWGAGLSPVFTDDGSNLVFRRDDYLKRRKYSSIVAYNFETKSEKILEEQNRNLTRPFKTTSGDIVYKKKNNFFVYNRNLSNKINTFTGKLIDTGNSNFVLYEDGNPVTLNFSKEDRYLWASLSPDQSKILFTKAGEGTYISDLTGKILVELGYANAPVWSPDGKWIVYMDEKDNG